MTTPLGKEPFNVVEYGKALDEFHLAFGRTLSQWSLIEERLSNFFWYLTGMQYGMARAIFYSPRSFKWPRRPS
jgi:hypothetical protein